MHPSITAILVSRFMLDLHETYRAMAHQDNLSSIQVMGSLRCDPAADEGLSSEEEWSSSSDIEDTSSSMA